MKYAALIQSHFLWLSLFGHHSQRLIEAKKKLNIPNVTCNQSGKLEYFMR